MCFWQRQDPNLVTILRNINLAFLIIFILEIILKLYGLGAKQFFSDGWNIFDFVVVLITIVGVIIESFGILSIYGVVTSVIRTFRIVRVLRLIKEAKSLRTIFKTFLVTLPALANIGSLLFLVLFIFSVLANNLFAYI